jgi:sugar/nucleoside kinase (ribokinase family)
MDVLVTGYPSIDHIANVSHSPSIGETARLYELPDTVTFGGCGTNIGMALARLGFRVGAALVLGDDLYGMDYSRHLAAIGIDTANIVALRGHKTSRSYLFLNPDGQYQSFFYPGAADAWTGDLRLKGVETYCYALVTVGQFDYNRQFVAQVHSAGVPLIWSLKSDIVAYPPDMVRDFAHASTFIIMNPIEAHTVLEALAYNTVEKLLNNTTEAVVITRGEQGAQVITADGQVDVPAVTSREVVDPTGAGDGFTAGFMAGLLRDETAEISARIGGVVASYVLEAVGCQTNLPTWRAVVMRYEQHFGKLAGAE